ncbi:MAG: O-antigen ligase family protein [Rhodospirillaceae bacterium]
MIAERPATRPPNALVLTMLLALPVVGLVAGPLYAALVFGLGGAATVLTAAAERRPPALDRPLAALALAFAALCWASALWSIVPGHSAAAAGQLSLILAAALVVLTLPPPAAPVRATAMHWLPRAMSLGVAVLCLDTALGYPLQGLMGHQGTKYNRGLNYLVLLAWPLAAAFAAERRWTAAAALGGLMVVAVTVGVSVTGTLALAAGGAVFLLALLLRGATAPALFGLMAALVAALPFLLHAAAAARQSLWPYIKFTGFHRLEIWDYMTARVLEHPWLGWGFLSAKFVPIRPEELATYRFASDSGVYPHNQWLELWIETGAVGAALGLAFLALVLWRIRALPAATRPFAFAACGSAMTISWFNFEIATDSWWAALTTSALLFSWLSAPPPHPGDADGGSAAW